MTRMRKAMLGDRCDSVRAVFVRAIDVRRGVGVVARRGCCDDGGWRLRWSRLSSGCLSLSGGGRYLVR